MGRKGKTATDDPQDEGGINEVLDSTKQSLENEEEKNGVEGKYFQCFETLEYEPLDLVIIK